MKAIHNDDGEWPHIYQAVNYTQRYKKWKQFTTCRTVLMICVLLWTIHKDTKNESNSQHHTVRTVRPMRCELYTKIQKMKAIHNSDKLPSARSRAVNYTQRYKKWKQFTTATMVRFLLAKLWTIHKDTKNESNSQPNSPCPLPGLCCELYTKIQKMKAIHNHGDCCVDPVRAVNYTQRYKKWKQFTTRGVHGIFVYSCELYTKIQKMKAIHNSMPWRLRDFWAVNYTQRYKKWKQFTTCIRRRIWGTRLWTIHKDTKNESNSQRGGKSPLVVMRCELYTKIQKMKAIHNGWSARWCSPLLWTIHKDTKNESNSQQPRQNLRHIHGCELYTKIQKMKAIHNRASGGFRITNAVNYTQRYKKWKQFTTYQNGYYRNQMLWTIHKDTKNESNSQPFVHVRCMRARCELYTKIQKMKAIHNYRQYQHATVKLWTIHKDTKNESNSQHTRSSIIVYLAVNYTQRYKKWKQFTTTWLALCQRRMLWTIHKDTIIRSIHNCDNLVKYAAMLLGNRFR